VKTNLNPAHWRERIEHGNGYPFSHSLYQLAGFTLNDLPGTTNYQSVIHSAREIVVLSSGAEVQIQAYVQHKPLTQLLLFRIDAMEPKALDASNLDGVSHSIPPEKRKLILAGDRWRNAFIRWPSSHVPERHVRHH
jgi:hypothetical protein